MNLSCIWHAFPNNSKNHAFTRSSKKRVPCVWRTVHAQCSLALACMDALAHTSRPQLGWLVKGNVLGRDTLTRGRRRSRNELFGLKFPTRPLGSSTKSLRLLNDGHKNQCGNVGEERPRITPTTLGRYHVGMTHESARALLSFKTKLLSTTSLNHADVAESHSVAAALHARLLSRF